MNDKQRVQEGQISGRGVGGVGRGDHTQPGQNGRWFRADEGLLLALNGTKWKARVRWLLAGRRWGLMIVWRDPR